MREHQDLLRVALAAAHRAAAYIRTAERPGADVWQVKARHDFVTRVDLESEELIAEVLLREYPGSAVLGEELSPDQQLADLVWIVDPLDGTTNFLHGYPAYAVSIAAAVCGSPVAGVVLDVPRDVAYHATRGGGAWCAGRRLAVSTVSEPGNALIGTGFPFKRPELLPAYLRQFAAIMQRTSGIRRAGAASLDFADLAQGRFDGFWELHLAPWDVAAGSLLVQEAGGVVTDLEAGGEAVRHGAFVAGNRAIHGWLLRVLAE